MPGVIKIPSSLRIWFFVHFLVDYFFAVPLFLFPYQTLGFFGWGVVDPIAARLVAAALLAIGGISFVARNSDVAVYKSLLIMKIIWSFFAVEGILLTAFVEGVPLLAWAIFAIFLFFSSVWIYYYSWFEKEK